MLDKLWLKERITAWKNPNLRAFWIRCGEKPKRCELSRAQLQGVFKNTALASSAVVEPVHAVAGLDITAIIPRGAESGTAGTIDIEKQFAILAKVVLLVIERDINLVGGKARVEKLRAAFQDVVDMVTSHGEANHQAIKIPVHKVRIAPFIYKDLEHWLTAVHDAALSAKSNWHEPPGIDQLPGAGIPTWEKIDAYVDTGGLSTLTFTTNRLHLVKKEGVRSNVRAWMKTPLSFRASVGPSGGDAGSSEREIRAITATVRPTNPENGREAEEAPVGPHTRNPRLVFARYRALPRRETKTGAGKGGSSAKSSKGDDE